MFVTLWIRAGETGWPLSAYALGNSSLVRYTASLALLGSNGLYSNPAVCLL